MRHFVFGVFFLALCVWGQGASSVASERFEVSFDAVLIDMGEAKQALLEDTGKPLATLVASENLGTLSAASSDFRSSWWKSEAGDGVSLGIRLTAESPIFGTFDRLTGHLEFASTFRWQAVQGSPSESGGQGTCASGAFPLVLSSHAESQYAGLPGPFVEGPDAGGSVLGSWSALPRSEHDEWCGSEQLDRFLGFEGPGQIILMSSWPSGVSDPPMPGPGPILPAPPTTPPEARALKGKLGLRASLRKQLRSHGLWLATGSVRNHGDGVARNVRVCVRTSMKARSLGNRCRQLSSIWPGHAKKVRFRVRSSRPLGRGGPKVALSLAAKAGEVLTPRRWARSR